MADTCRHLADHAWVTPMRRWPASDAGTRARPVRRISERGDEAMSSPTATGVAPPPPLDAACAAALAALPRRDPWSTPEELIAILRASTPFDGTDAEVTLDGRYRLEERRARTFDGREVALLVCQPGT